MREVIGSSRETTPLPSLRQRSKIILLYNVSTERTVPTKYPYLLFDANDTLFDFPQAAAHAFTALRQTHDIPNTAENRALWDAFDRGEITKDFVTPDRFVRFLQTLGLDRDPAACNRGHLASLGAGVYPLPHAEAVCRGLKARGHRLYIVTNAVASVQRSRLRGSVFNDLMDGVFIFEEAGAAKPAPAYCDYVRARLPELTAENCLVIGNSQATDMQGANNAGLHCC